MKINLAEDFGNTPAPRYESQGDFSGEEFFKTILKKALKNLSEDELVIINLNGLKLNPSSFWSEVFLRAKEEFGVDVLNKITYVCSEKESRVGVVNYYKSQHAE